VPHRPRLRRTAWHFAPSISKYRPLWRPDAIQTVFDFWTTSISTCSPHTPALFHFFRRAVWALATSLRTVANESEMSAINIDWTKFSQCPLSDKMWAAFRGLVHESHLYTKHKAEAREARRMARVRDPSSPQNAKRAKRHWEDSARSHDNKWHRAEFLAHEALNRMAKIGSDSGEENPDWPFSIAIINAVGSLDHQTRCDFSVTALHSIDVKSSLQLPPDEFKAHLRDLGRPTTTRPE
jgi:hypothetical protein